MNFRACWAKVTGLSFLSSWMLIAGLGLTERLMRLPYLAFRRVRVDWVMPCFLGKTVVKMPLEM